jgi:(1->4)-alpha-D-glucan 1-alpha-D-glucosylmutase
MEGRREDAPSAAARDDDARTTRTDARASATDAEGTDAVEEEVEALLAAALARARTGWPNAVYRVQLHGGFGFRDALAVVPYLAALGVSDLYLSPILMATPGSAHGYDVVDHAHLDPDLGTEEELRALSSALTERGMRLLLDTVPNHVGIGRWNARWLDLLENGPSSIHARFFDIDWNPLKPELSSKILLPILGDQYGVVLERGELRLAFEVGSFWLHYYDERLPIAPRSYATILRRGLAALEASLARAPESAERTEREAQAELDVQELLSVLTAIENLPPRFVTSTAKVLERHREKEIVKRRLGALYERSPEIRAHVDAAVAGLNGAPGDAASFDALDALLGEQAYRLAFWRVAGEEINYRRFFDINSLAAIRQEDPVVFEETHRVVLRLLRDGIVHGLRIDHPDGLFDPSAYLRALQEEVVAAAARALAKERDLEAAAIGPLEHAVRRRYRERLAERPGDPALRPVYVVVEKILGGKERVPDSWPIDGTVGYEFLGLLNGLFVDGENEERLTRSYERALGERIDFGALVRRSKTLIMKTSMVSEVNVLAHGLSALSERNRRTRDFTLNSLRHALIEIVACFPIYRTYVDGFEVDDRDRRYVLQAVAAARRGTGETNAATIDFIRDILLMEPILGGTPEVRREHLSFVMKLQQVTGPVMAKGLEDTAFYVFNRLCSLNEVGGEPERFGTTVAELHRANGARARRFPASLLSTSTHDTKRSEDVRVRIDVLSEVPDAWDRFLLAAMDANKGRRTLVDGRPAPDPNEELLIYQALLGVVERWPPAEGEREALRARLEGYALKALREAKVHSSWTDANAAWEQATSRFVGALFEPREPDPFDEALRALLWRVQRVGRLNALSQQLLKMTSPGVPDLYQGTELWELSLVDPDNRRPVDFALRERLLSALSAELAGPGARATLARALWANPADPRLKLFVTWLTLQARRADPELFRDGAYVPLDVAGPRARSVVAFARTAGRRVAIVAAPRLVAPLLGERRPWRGTFLLLPGEIADRLSGGALLDAFTAEPRETVGREGGAALSVETLFEGFPLALLTSEAASP